MRVLLLMVILLKKYRDDDFGEVTRGIDDDGSILDGDVAFVVTIGIDIIDDDDDDDV